MYREKKKNKPKTLSIHVDTWQNQYNIVKLKNKIKNKQKKNKKKKTKMLSIVFVSNLRIKPRSSTLQADSLLSEPPEKFLIIIHLLKAFLFQDYTL